MLTCWTPWDTGRQAASGTPPSNNKANTGEATTQPSVLVDDELVRRLLGGQSSAADTITETLERMDQAAKRLTDALDPGSRTQALQKKTLDGIDALIEQARKNRVSSRRGAGGQRKMNRRPGRRRPSGSPGETGAPDPTPATKDDLARSGDKAGKGRQTRRTDKAELTRGWGFLPDRDRNEILQGYDEEFLSQYREQIIRYYRDLARKAQELQE